MPGCMRGGRSRISILSAIFRQKRCAMRLTSICGPRPSPSSPASTVSETFDARFSAKARHYLYRIVNRRARLALDRDRAWQVPVPLDASAMQEAARHLIGRHDFTTFRSSQCQGKSPLRTLDRLEITRDGEDVLIAASAQSFLHHQVRSMAGSLKLVGERKWLPEDMRRAARSPRPRCLRPRGTCLRALFHEGRLLVCLNQDFLLEIEEAMVADIMTPAFLVFAAIINSALFLSVFILSSLPRWLSIPAGFLAGIGFTGAAFYLFFMPAYLGGAQPTPFLSMLCVLSAFLLTILVRSRLRRRSLPGNFRHIFDRYHRRCDRREAVPTKRNCSH